MKQPGLMSEHKQTGDRKMGNKIVKLTEKVQVEIGGKINITNHPSGSEYNGTGTIKSAFRNAQGVNVIKAVSDGDPVQRLVTIII